LARARQLRRSAGDQPGGEKSFVINVSKITFYRILIHETGVWNTGRLNPEDLGNYANVTVHRWGSGSFFGEDLRVLRWTLPPKNVPDPLSFPKTASTL